MTNLDKLEQIFRNRPVGLQGVTASYGVLVPVVDCALGPALLFEVRAKTLDRQPGEVCFPGGRMEPGEDSIQCALRETAEEIGLLSADISVIAPLDCLIHASGAVMYPVLASIKEESLGRLSLSPAEVEEVFLVPLTFFEDHPPEVYHSVLVQQATPDFPYSRIGFPAGYPWRGGKNPIPVYDNPGPVVWGLTARIVSHLVEILQKGG